MFYFPQEGQEFEEIYYVEWLVIMIQQLISEGCLETQNHV